MKKPTSKRKSTAANGARTPNSDDEVRNSLDLLDSVIGEFDDGLTSAAESEYGGITRENGRIEAEIRKRPPPKNRSSNGANGSGPGNVSLTDKIDDIFSELTEEIYSADKQQKIINRAPMRSESTNSDSRKLSPIRRVNDPLPTPPVQGTVPTMTTPSSNVPRKINKDEVVVYSEHQSAQDRPKDVISLKKSVKAQVHSLETRGRHHRVISTEQNESKNDKPTFTKNNNRSRSENPPKSRNAAGHPRTNGMSNKQPMSLAPTLEDDFASRVNPSKTANKTTNPPPPMPEKTRIHLKKNEISPSKKSSSKSSSSSSSNNRQRRPDQPLPDLPSSFEPSSLPSSNQYESMLTPLTAESKTQQYRRSRSLGPVVEAAQKELLASAAAARERSKSRLAAEQKQAEVQRTKSKNRYDHHQPTGHGKTPQNSNFRKEGSSLESSRGRSRMKSNLVERSVSSSNKKPSQSGPSKVDIMDPFSRMMPARQKSMIDLRDQGRHGTPPRMFHHVHQQQQHAIHHHHQLESMPPHHHHHVPQQQSRRPGMMQRSATEHDIKVRNRRSMAVGPFEDLPVHIRQHMARQHGFDFGLLGGSGNRRNGPMSTRDRQLAEEDAILMRQLTLESQREFLMRRGFSPSHPFISGEVPIHPELQGRLPFHVPSRTIPLRPDDYQRFKPEYWLQNHNHPNPVAFTDLAVLQSELELKRRRELHRQNSQKEQQHQSRRQQEPPMNAAENNFNSLPWEEIIPRRIGGIPVLPPEHEQQKKSRSKSQGRSGFGSAWFNPGHVFREAEPDVRGLGGSNVKQQGHWVLKESPAMLSMPPNMDTLRDSGIGLASVDNVDHQHLSRNEPKRSSFGMALKDKFNKNPNMYFPGQDDNSSSRSRGSQASNSGGRKSRSTSSPTKTQTSIEEDMMSDTDTLIHNMSDGSYDKDNSSNLSSGDGHESFGSSAKGSRSSGNSSLSPHNSMEGSPRLNPQFQPPPLHNNSANPGVSLGKKTIRNYTPKESSNMLREFEDRRNNSVDWRKQQRQNKKPSLERKSSMDRMIDDFHKSLPPPSSAEATMTTTATGNSSKKASKNGTMNSQISNWSAASSAASFDYQPGMSKSSPGMKKTRSTRDLPSVDEDEDELCHGERVPPEGAPSASNGVSPTNFVHRIEIKSKASPRNSPVRRKSKKDIEELPLPPPPPPPPPIEPSTTTNNEDQDDFSNLRKLISEGRISGLNEKPPSFIPPSPPSSTKNKVERSVSATRRPSSAKPPAPTTPKTPKSSHSAERQPSRKNREAPKPPVTTSNVSTPSSDIKFVSSRQRESLEDLTQMNSKKRNEVKRSSSNHGTRPSGFDSRIDDTNTAQLIADCAERKFNFNPFKGKLFKKKQYSFDFN